MNRDFIAIRTFSNELDATTAQEHLRAAGLDSYVFKDDAGGMYPMLQPLRGVRLMVSREDAAEAEGVLEALEI